MFQISQESDPTVEGFVLFAQRFMHFMNLYTVYRDFLSGYYVPTVDPMPDDSPYPQMDATLKFMLYAYFYSLIEHDVQGLNAFTFGALDFPEKKAPSPR
jgi:hypothetical protein